MIGAYSPSASTLKRCPCTPAFYSELISVHTKAPDDVFPRDRSRSGLSTLLLGSSCKHYGSMRLVNSRFLGLVVVCSHARGSAGLQSSISALVRSHFFVACSWLSTLNQPLDGIKWTLPLQTKTQSPTLPAVLLAQLAVV